MHSAFVPHGLGLHGSGFSLHPEIVSGLGTHGSGGGVRTTILEQPVIVSGAGSKP